MQNDRGHTPCECDSFPSTERQAGAPTVVTPGLWGTGLPTGAHSCAHPDWESDPVAEGGGLATLMPTAL